MPARACGPGLRLAAGGATKVWAPTSVEVAWVAQASRPAAGLLLRALGTPCQATIQRTAYRTDGKPAIGRSEGRASAERGYQYPGTGWKGKGLRLSATPLTCIGRDEITQMAHVRVAEGANEFGRDLDSASERRQ